MAFDLSRETLDRTWFEAVLPSSPGHLVNVERALRVGDRLGGHMVSGHVDTQGALLERRETGDGGAEFVFEVPEGFERYLFDKGSVTIDGISLTVVALAAPFRSGRHSPHLARPTSRTSRRGPPSTSRRISWASGSSAWRSRGMPEGDSSPG